LFEMASLLTGQPIQPEALFPSQHVFINKDLRSLAVRSSSARGLHYRDLSVIEVDRASVADGAAVAVVDGAATERLGTNSAKIERGLE
jgi:hypothetical protein